MKEIYVNLKEQDYCYIKDEFDEEELDGDEYDDEDEINEEEQLESDNVIEEVLDEMGINLNVIEEIEEDAGLGNGEIIGFGEMNTIIKQLVDLWNTRTPKERGGANG